MPKPYFLPRPSGLYVRFLVPHYAQRLWGDSLRHRNADGAPLDCVASLIAAQRQMAGDRRLATFQSRHRLPPHMTLSAFQAGAARGLSVR